MGGVYGDGGVRGRSGGGKNLSSGIREARK